MSKSEKISIVGSGLIGKSFAMLFAGAGYQVFMYDVEKSQITLALSDIKKQLKELEASGMLRGSLTADEQFACIKGSQSLEECLENSIHAQECVPENLEIKTKCNPPYYVPAVEVVPAPWTSKDVMRRTCTLLKEIGLVPIKFAKETPGFAGNRIQYAILNECWHLVKDGVLGTEDVDNLMKEGLAMRYVWCGPFETIHLNAEGTDNYVERYGKTINSVSQTFKPVPSWTQEDAKEISDEMEAKIPLDQLQERRAWRDARLIALTTLRKQMKEKKD